MTDLILHLTGEYFDQIDLGEKPEEYRLQTPYWKKRLVGREFKRVLIYRGYPPKSDISRRIIRPWRGYIERTITHPHFGVEPVLVFAIRVGL